MKLFSFTLLAASICTIAFQSFATAGLYVVQVGDGSAALSSASTVASIKKFSTSGSSEGTLNLPTTASGANKPLTLSGSSTSEGFLALSANGEYLTLAGYGVGPGTPAVPQTDSTVVNRVIGLVNLSTDSIDTTTALTNAYNSGGTANNSNIRSAVSSDGTKFWTGGTAFGDAVLSPLSAGVQYAATLGATTSSQVSANPSNARVVKIFNNQLYLSSGSGAFTGINTVGTGLPSEEGTVTTRIVDATVTNNVTPAVTASPYDFWFKDSNTLYVADDRAVTSGGGIQKWTLNDNVWTFNYTLSSNVGNGLRGLTGEIVGGNAVLYATTAQNSANRLVSVTDTGVASTYTTLATAPTNTAFRGIVFAEVADVGIPGDFNDDGRVDGRDFLAWQRGNSPSPLSASDLTDWQNNYGTGALAAIGSVPEPTSLGLLALALVPIVSGRKR